MKSTSQFPSADETSSVFVSSYEANGTLIACLDLCACPFCHNDILISMKNINRNKHTAGSLHPTFESQNISFGCQA